MTPVLSFQSNPQLATHLINRFVLYQGTTSSRAERSKVRCPGFSPCRINSPRGLSPIPLGSTCGTAKSHALIQSNLWDTFSKLETRACLINAFLKGHGFSRAVRASVSKGL